LNRRIVVGVALGALGGLVLLAAYYVWSGRERPTVVLEVQPLTDPRQVRVYVGGAVAAPGLYTLPRGSRVAEAIDAAGGVTVDGDTTTLGMAAPLDDADQIIVPARHSTPTPTSSAESTDRSTSASVDTPAPTGPATTVTMPATTNINTASAAELDTLPGIGPAIAGRIIEYREAHGPFQSIDELEAIKGISAAMVDELRPLVTVGP
jgi:competence protein ComEA